MTPVTFTLTPGVSVTAISVTALTRSDTGLTPPGVSLPLLMSGAGGVFTATIADTSALPPATYQATAILTLASGGFSRPFTFAITPADQSIPGAYLTAASAAAIAATLPAGLLAAFTAANVAAQAAALLAASLDLDNAMHWQGRKFNRHQANEFPRVLYESSSPGTPYAGMAWGYDGNAYGSNAGIDDVADWDCTTQTAVVPPNVLTAIVYQANWILAGGDPRQDDIHGGVKQQANSGLQETYDRSAPGAHTNLCLRAWHLVKRYKRVAGRMI